MAWEISCGPNSGPAEVTKTIVQGDSWKFLVVMSDYVEGLSVSGTVKISDVKLLPLFSQTDDNLNWYLTLRPVDTELMTPGESYKGDVQYIIPDDDIVQTFLRLTIKCEEQITP